MNQPQAKIHTKNVTIYVTMTSAPLVYVALSLLMRAMQKASSVPNSGNNSTVIAVQPPTIR